MNTIIANNYMSSSKRLVVNRTGCEVTQVSALEPEEKIKRTKFSTVWLREWQSMIVLVSCVINSIHK